MSTIKFCHRQVGSTFHTGPHLVAPAACRAVGAIPPSASVRALRIGLASHGLARLAGIHRGGAVSSQWRPAKVSLFTLAAGHHERRKLSDMFFFGGAGRRVVPTGCLARWHLMELKTQLQREQKDVDPHGIFCVKPEHATRGSKRRIS